MPEQTKRIFLSDVHLGRGGKWDWYQPSLHNADLMSALEHILANASAIKDLVLLGDIFDMWLGPVDEEPATMDHILEVNSEILELLAACAEALPNVFYLNGNHDMLTTQADLDRITKRGRRIKLVQRYHAGMLYAEHGNRYAMFNARDYLHDPVDGLPLGYYMTRMLAGVFDYKSPKSLFSYVDDLLEASFTTQQMAESVIEALMERIGHRPETVVKMSRPRRDVTLGEVQKRYAPLFERWVQKFGYLYAINAIRGEMKSLDWAAERLCRKNGFRVVVFGHTHDALAKEVPVKSWGSSMYVNCGNFCTGDPTLVEIDKQGGGNLLVSLLSRRENGEWKPRMAPTRISADWVEAEDSGPLSAKS